MTLDYVALLKPLSEKAPCGVDLDETGGLSVFNGMRIFGQQLKPLGDVVPPTDDQQPGARSTIRQYRWREVLDEAAKTLAVSKDIRLLTYASAATLRVEGLESFTRNLEVAAGWLDAFWDSLYPRIEPEPEARSNALCSFADKMAILDAIRRAPLAVHKQFGTCSFRDIEQTGTTITRTAKSAAAADPSAIFQSVALNDLLGLESVIGRAVGALGAIETLMRERTANKTVPDLSGLTDLLKQIRDAVAKFVDPRRAETGLPSDTIVLTGAAAEAQAGAAAGASSVGEAAIVAVGSIRSRQDAIRALDAVADFFRKNEPSSPVPLFVERSKRLITMGFMELLADVVPTAVAQAKAAAGLPSDSK
jgi:type VI secretion system protein ImpA